MYNLKNKISFGLLGVLISTFLVQCNSKKEENNSNEIDNTKSTIVKNTEDFKEHYSSGNLKIVGQFIDEKKTGKWILYYENGEIKSIENFKNGKRDGYHKTDYSGDLYMEGSYKEDIKIGIWKSYFKEKKTLKYLKQYDDKGLAKGEWKNYYDTGEIASVDFFIEGRANGKQTEYFKNGNISKIGEKINGKETGLWKYYYDNGNIRCEREFKDGVDDGKYIEYFKNGKIYKIGNKVNYKKSGEWKIYNEQGNLVDTIFYKNDP